MSTETARTIPYRSTNWSALKSEFVHGCESGPEFAAARGLNYDAVHGRIGRDHWMAARRNFQEVVRRADDELAIRIALERSAQRVHP